MVVGRDPRINWDLVGLPSVKRLSGFAMSLILGREIASNLRMFFLIFGWLLL